MTNSNEPPRRPARRQPTRRSTTPRTSVPSARDELERERELYSQHDPTASFMHERVQNKPASQERGASSAFPAYAGAGNDHIAHSRIATNQPAQTNQGYTADGNMSNVSAWDQHASASASQTDCRPGTHRGEILPRQGPRERTARVYCHCQSGQECIRAQSCHCQSPENAFRAYPAIAGRLGTHSVDILPSADIRECTASAYRHCQSPVTQRSPRGGVGSVPWLCCGVRRATLSVRGSGHSAFSGLNCWERFRVCAVSVGNHEPASRSAKLCRIMC
ncbi:unknown [Eggerthella sp. CAG:209]|nr:unknown [Eggerthella sp. CAG:209]